MITRSALVTAIRFRLDEPSDATATVPSRQRWTDSDVDAAISAACRMSRPLGIEAATHGVYRGNGRVPQFSFGTSDEILLVKSVTVQQATSGSADTGGNIPAYQTELPPSMWDAQTYTPNTLISLKQPMAATEELYVRFVLAQPPDAATIYVDTEVVTEYACGVLYQQGSAHGGVSNKQDDLARMQAHFATAEARKAQLLGLAAAQETPAPAPHTPARRKR